MSTATAPEPLDVRDRILATGQRIMGGKGFSAVGLNEVLTAAGVPKGSFYHYFGEALLEDYFAAYLAEMDATFRQPGLSKAQQLDAYFRAWRDAQSFEDCQGKCLAVKLGAEVADLSASMRAALQRGTAGIVERLARAIEAGVADGSLRVHGDPTTVAQSLYQLWLGASIMVKITRTLQPFNTALSATRQALHPSA
jgi:TetR/AcrR family transcriptional repressor of nem operon